ncbi:MAG: tetratricopeptide repeat protein [Myxococcota bacterium]
MSEKSILAELEARAQTDPHACYQLAEALLTGDHWGVTITKDEPRAAHWYGKAAEAGHRDALYELGFMHLLGEGIPHNPARGVELMIAAAEHDYDVPMRVLADSFRTGQFGVTPDEALAKKWADRLEAHRRANPSGD